MDKLKYYVDIFNCNDEEIYKNDIMKVLGIGE